MGNTENLEARCEHLYVLKIDIEEEFFGVGPLADVRFYPKYMCRACNSTFVDKADGYKRTVDGFYRKITRP